MDEKSLPIDRTMAHSPDPGPRIPSYLADPAPDLQKFRRLRPDIASASKDAQAAESLRPLLHRIVLGLAGASDLQKRNAELARIDAIPTGRRARAVWKTVGQALRLEDLFEAAWLGGRSAGERAKIDAAWTQVVQRHEDVEAHLARGKGSSSSFAPRVGERWIAVNAEDDDPWRPANVEIAEGARQHDAVFGAYQVRYIEVGKPNAPRLLLYLHGLGSRAEEGVGIANALEALHPGTYRMIAPDLPGHGYTTRTAPAGIDDGAFGVTQDPHPFSSLDDITQFVVDFKREVLRNAEPEVVLGGSLGATLTMRLSDSTSRWRPKRVASWSPAGYWEPMSMLALQYIAAVKPQYDKSRLAEPAGRAAYFAFSFEEPSPAVPPSFNRWWSKAHQQAHPLCVEQSICDRLELYAPNVRAWQLRLAYEQLCYSVRRKNRLARLGGGYVDPRPILMLCGSEDNDPAAKIYDNSRWVAQQLKAHPGRARWIAGSGHSLHDECPAQVARELHEFVESFPA